MTYHRFHAVHGDDVPSVDHAIKKLGILLVLFLVCAVVVGCVEVTKKKNKNESQISRQRDQSRLHVPCDLLSKMISNDSLKCLTYGRKP